MQVSLAAAGFSNSRFSLNTHKLESRPLPSVSRDRSSGASSTRADVQSSPRKHEAVSHSTSSSRSFEKGRVVQAPDQTLTLHGKLRGRVLLACCDAGHPQETRTTPSPLEEEAKRQKALQSARTQPTSLRASVLSSDLSGNTPVAHVLVLNHLVLQPTGFLLASGRINPAVAGTANLHLSPRSPAYPPSARYVGKHSCRSTPRHRTGRVQ
ncbi:hypothetical protein BV20DRAFT_970280 [Pilatotrama ljubarskyi]|nr:hypothetical protein BV20DRAFT_970280 [Pilatotrama ljubarskyi]